MPIEMPDEETMLVKSGLRADGTYGASLEMTADLAVELDETNSNLIATHVEATCARAEFIAKVYKQMRGLGTPQDDVLGTIVELRDKLPVDHSIDHLPFRTSSRLTVEGKPYLVVQINGEDTGQIDIGPALNWASHIRSARHWAALDQSYFGFLTEVITVDPKVAHNTIAALSEISVAAEARSVDPDKRRFFPNRVL